MGTTAQKLNKILETKEAIRTAINSKGGTLTTSNKFSDYATAINNIQSGGGGGGSLKTLLDATKSCYYLFSNYTGTSVDDLISYSDTSSVTDMASMFSNCKNLIGIPQLDTSKVTKMNYMFNNCSNLTAIPQLDTSNVTSMSTMFSHCSKLMTIPQLNTSKVTNIYEMFTYCFKLTTIDITHMNITSASDTGNFAYNCYSLTKLIIRNMTTLPKINSNTFVNCHHFTGTTNATWNPDGLKDGRIYVPDDKVEELKAATNWSKYADIIVPLSTLVE